MNSLGSYGRKSIIICVGLYLWTAAIISVQKDYFKDLNAEKYISEFYLNEFVSKGSLNIFRKEEHFTLAPITEKGFFLHRDSWVSSIIFFPSFLTSKTLLFLSSLISPPDCYYSDFEKVNFFYSLFLLVLVGFFLREALRALELSRNIDWVITSAFILTPVLGLVFNPSQKEISNLFLSSLALYIYLTNFNIAKKSFLTWFFVGALFSIASLLKIEFLLIAAISFLNLIWNFSDRSVKAASGFLVGMSAVHIIETIRLSSSAGFFVSAFSLYNFEKSFDIYSRFEIFNYLFSPYGILYLFPVFTIVISGYFMCGLDYFKNIEPRKNGFIFMLVGILFLIYFNAKFNKSSHLFDLKNIHIYFFYSAAGIGFLLQSQKIKKYTLAVCLGVFLVLNLNTLLKYALVPETVGLNYNLWSRHNWDQFYSLLGKKIVINGIAFFDLLFQDIILLIPFLYLAYIVVKKCLISGSSILKIGNVTMVLITVVYFIAATVSSFVDGAAVTSEKLKPTNGVQVKKDSLSTIVNIEFLYNELSKREKSVILYNQDKILEQIKLSKAGLVQSVTNLYSLEESNRIFKLLEQKDRKAVELRDRCQ